MADAADLKSAPTASRLVQEFIESRPNGLSPGTTLKFYSVYLKNSLEIIGFNITGQHIQRFINRRTCSSGGKHAYYRALRAFYNWLYSPKSAYHLEPQRNPIQAVSAPKVHKKILPSLSSEQLQYLISQARCSRDKAIISLFADSGLRLTEIANIQLDNIDWQGRLIKVRCKGNKEGLAPFSERTETLLKDWLKERNNGHNRLWDIGYSGISWMLRLLAYQTSLPCNPHTFRRTFACLLRKQGLDCLTIKDLGRWESVAMVERYTRSITFQDSLKFYKGVL